MIGVVHFLGGGLSCPISVNGWAKLWMLVAAGKQRTTIWQLITIIRWDLLIMPEHIIVGINEKQFIRYSLKGLLPFRFDFGDLIEKPGIIDAHSQLIRQLLDEQKILIRIGIGILAAKIQGADHLIFYQQRCHDG